VAAAAHVVVVGRDGELARFCRCNHPPPAGTSWRIWTRAWVASATPDHQRRRPRRSERRSSFGDLHGDLGVAEPRLPAPTDRRPTGWRTVFNGDLCAVHIFLRRPDRVFVNRGESRGRLSMNDVVRLLRRALPEVRACPTARGAAGRRSTGDLRRARRAATAPERTGHEFRRDGDDPKAIVLEDPRKRYFSYSAHQGARVGILVSWGGKVGDVVVGWDTRIPFSDPMLDSLLSDLVGIALWHPCCSIMGRYGQIR
jgi:hypothetical protein